MLAKIKEISDFIESLETLHFDNEGTLFLDHESFDIYNDYNEIIEKQIIEKLKIDLEKYKSEEIKKLKIRIKELLKDT